ncbi:hypothetical protein [Streptomyces umbrinus]|uniref:hypothetical protein n=1 Tax=Streptomyces umbrinus TaxID=67370 RepID=UPI003C2BDDCF
MAQPLTTAAAEAGDLTAGRLAPEQVTPPCQTLGQHRWTSPAAPVDCYGATPRSFAADGARLSQEFHSGASAQAFTVTRLTLPHTVRGPVR